jgi:hypothetical protein
MLRRITLLSFFSVEVAVWFLKRPTEQKVFGFDAHQII